MMGFITMPSGKLYLPQDNIWVFLNNFYKIKIIPNIHVN